MPKRPMYSIAMEVRFASFLSLFQAFCKASNSSSQFFVYRCDFQDDCGNYQKISNSLEWFLKLKLTILISLKTIFPLLGDMSDENPEMCKDLYRECTESEFQCNNKRCLPMRWRCLLNCLGLWTDNYHLNIIVLTLNFLLISNINTHLTTTHCRCDGMCV